MAETALSGVSTDAAGRRLEQLVRTSAFPVCVVGLPDPVVLEVSDGFAELLGRPRDELKGLRLWDFLTDPEAAQDVLRMLAEGKLDAYTRRATYRRPDDTVVQFIVRWTAAMDESPRRHALAMVLNRSEFAAGSMVHTPPELPRVVLGTVDGQWRLDRITTDIELLMGSPPEDLLGQTVFTSVHPEDIPLLLTLAATASGHGSATGRVRLRTKEGEWLLCRICVQALGGEVPAGFAFAIFSPSADLEPAPERARELEEHLRRIAGEVTASGVAAMGMALPTALEVPALATLSTREYEIVVRLAGGERIGTIARRLFLSESTIRNHLTAAYRKFGVTSQSELLALLARGKTD